MKKIWLLITVVAFLVQNSKFCLLYCKNSDISISALSLRCYTCSLADQKRCRRATRLKNAVNTKTINFWNKTNSVQLQLCPELDVQEKAQNISQICFKTFNISTLIACFKEIFWNSFIFLKQLQISQPSTTVAARKVTFAPS